MSQYVAESDQISTSAIKVKNSATSLHIMFLGVQFLEMIDFSWLCLCRGVLSGRPITGVLIRGCLQSICMFQCRWSCTCSSYHQLPLDLDCSEKRELSWMTDSDFAITVPRQLFFLTELDLCTSCTHPRLHAIRPEQDKLEQKLVPAYLARSYLARASLEIPTPEQTTGVSLVAE